MITTGRYFISKDWGTSKFRMRLIEPSNGVIIDEYSSDEGIGVLNQQFETDIAQQGRIFFFRRFIGKKLNEWAREGLEGIPILISGMASSTLGIEQLEYRAVPFNTEEHVPELKLYPADDNCKHPIVLISGLKTVDDVMRGEETILMGLNRQELEFSNHIILPGTHSKHITLKNGSIDSFQTFLTGELFDLLSTKSVLTASLENSIFDEDAFALGVREASSRSLLEGLFKARTNDLFTILNKKQNFHWLSGLLIGSELESFKKVSSATLVSNPGLRKAYEFCLRLIQPSIDLLVLEEESKLVAGHLAIYKRISE